MSAKKEGNNEEKLNRLLSSYLEENKDSYVSSKEMFNLELEVRFNKGKKISRIHYENVIKRLLHHNFDLGEKTHSLRIGLEYLDEKSGYNKQSSVRVEIDGITNISKYCKSDKLEINNSEIHQPTKFTQKSNFKSKEGVFIDPIDYFNYGFRVAFQTEKGLHTHNPLVKNIISQWGGNKKTFRYITRHRMTHKTLPFNIDLSVIKESKRRGNRYIPENTFKDSGVLDSYETYEIEIEVDNKRLVGDIRVEELNIGLKRVIKYILSGLQNTNYPISYDEQNEVSDNYKELLWGKTKEGHGKRVGLYNRNFVGPSSLTLQLQNVVKDDGNSNIPNILDDYTVTDKADGERKLLFISNKGRIYLIDTNMNIEFTGAITKRNEYYNTLIDGEHILHNKDNNYINLYACFDLYYFNGKDKRSLPFLLVDQKGDSRYNILKSTITNINIQSILGDNKPAIRIDYKSFYATTPKSSIFLACNTILSKEKQGSLEYNIDGLVFTPALLGVGAGVDNIVGKPLKTTWSHSLKWKAEKDNTIDFLVSVKKNTSGQDEIGSLFEEGINLSEAFQVSQYKTLILNVGFNEKVHGYVNPCQSVIDDDIRKVSYDEETADYRPMRFYPTNPEDVEAAICKMMLKEGKNGDKVLMTENKEVIEDNMIVEFRYNKEKEGNWKWEPLRVRYDKTADLRSGGRNYGNAFHVANSNWHTIHNPITEKMITTGKDVPDEIMDSDVYYNKGGNETSTMGLRNFHNLFVKKKLITSVTKVGGNLIDFSVGKGGDMSKWLASKLKFVFGVDISRDNIENRLDGVCARYLNNKKKFDRMFSGLFVVGNSSVNIRNGDGIVSDKGKKITKAVFGVGAKDLKELGKNVYNNFGAGSTGFDVGSIQFALHYMFENQLTLQNFLRNASECIKVGGYFIGTCYDGQKIFDLLKSKTKGESLRKMKDSRTIWEITKDYEYEGFMADNTSVGYSIKVYQESINKTFREYLVNYDYLKRLMENYGFAELTRDECKELGLENSSGLFEDLFNMMIEDNKKYKNGKRLYGDAIDMTNLEKQISFLNRYFIFKKVRNVDAEKVSNALINNQLDKIIDDQLAVDKEIPELEVDADNQNGRENDDKREEKPEKPEKPKKTRKKKLKLVEI